MPRKQRVPQGRVFHKTYRDRQGVLRETKVWHLKFYSRGRAVELSTGTEDLEQARRILHEKMAAAIRMRAHGGEPARVYVGHLLDLLIESYRFHRRRSLYDTELRVEKHLRPLLGGVLVEALTSARIRQYVEQRQREAAASATINKELAFLRHALRLGAAEDPPLVLRVPHVRLLPVSNAREGTLTHEQYRAVRDLLPPYARIALVIAYHTGARKGEIVGIRREHIDLAKRRILIPAAAAKNGAARYLVVYGDLAAELEMALAALEPSCPYLLQETVGGKRGRPKRTVRVESFTKAWVAACKGAKVEGALFHDLRRTAVTNMIEAGLSEREAMAISGHKTRSVFDRYHIVSDRRLREMGAKLEGHLAAKDVAAAEADAVLEKGRPS